MSKRGENKVKDSYTFKHMYEDYIADKVSYSPYYISKEEYRSIVSDFIKEMMNYVLYEAGTLKMPHRLGNIRVIKIDQRHKRKRRLSVDFYLTNRYGKTIYHYNEHSDGYKYMFKWDKRNSILPHKSFYRFIPTRRNKRTLAYIIKNKIADFFEN